MRTTIISIAAWAIETDVYIASKDGFSGLAQPKDQAGWDQKLALIDQLKVNEAIQFWRVTCKS